MIGRESSGMRKALSWVPDTMCYMPVPPNASLETVDSQHQTVGSCWPNLASSGPQTTAWEDAYPPNKDGPVTTQTVARPRAYFWLSTQGELGRHYEMPGIKTSQLCAKKVPSPLYHGSDAPNLNV